MQPPSLLFSGTVNQPYGIFFCIFNCDLRHEEIVVCSNARILTSNVLDK